jgi:hypothetical protein
MSLQTINIGSAANDGTGDTLREAFGKVNENFAALTEQVGLLSYAVYEDAVLDVDATFVAAIAAAQALTEGGCVVVPEGTYVVTAPVDLLSKVSLELRPGAVVRAGAAIAAVVRTPLSALVQNRAIYGFGEIDCADLATYGVDLRYFEDFWLVDVTIQDPVSIHIKLGDSGAPTTSYGAKVRGVRAHRRSGVAMDPGSIGLWMVSGSGDHKITDSVFMAETGVRLDSANNTLVGVHCWTRASNGWMVTCFDDNSLGNIFIGCYADTPQTYGFRLRRFNSVLIGCKVYNNNFYGVDNTVTGIYCDELTPFFTAIGTQFKGEGSGRRIAKDFDVAPTGTLENATILGSQHTNVVSAQGARISTSLSQKGNLFVTGGVNTDTGVFSDTYGSRTGAPVAFGGDVTFGGAVRVTDPLTLGNTTVVLEGVGSGMPDLAGTADSSDSLTEITDAGMLILSENSERQRIRFRCSGTGKAGSGGISFGLQDNNDFLLHRFDDGSTRVRLDYYDFVADTVANAGEFGPNRTILRGQVETPGTYDKPFKVSGFRLWEDGSSNFRIKTSDPASSTDGNVVQQIISGITGSRPTPTVVGFQYYDTTLQKPIWWNGSTWKDAAGVAA